ncbi:hypothetical protein GGI42DRAFT_337224 [Trichoderma sp. SZMC 28013]
MSLLLETPVEIIRLIAQTCSVDDLNSFRRTCKAIYLASLDVFGSRLANRRVMLAEPSLQHLIAIAQHKRWKDYVRSLDISTAHFTRHHPPILAPQHIKIYYSLQWDQECFVSSGRAMEKLRDAVKGLTRCKSIILTDANKKIPRGTRALTNVMALEPQGGADILSTYEMKDFVRQTLDATIAAATAASHVVRLGICVADPGPCLENAKCIGLCPYYRDSLKSPDIIYSMRIFNPQLDLKRLTSLHLVVYTDSANIDRNIRFEEYLSHFKNLVYLGLVCHQSNYPCGMLGRLSSLRFHKLRSLALRGMNGRRQELLHFLGSHEHTLQMVLLRGIGLQGGWENLRRPMECEFSYDLKIYLCYDIVLNDLAGEFSVTHKGVWWKSCV